jgi:hypothetical protein
MSESKKSSNFFKDMRHVASHSDPSRMRIGLIHGVHRRALQQPGAGRAVPMRARRPWEAPVRPRGCQLRSLKRQPVLPAYPNWARSDHQTAVALVDWTEMRSS